MTDQETYKKNVGPPDTRYSRQFPPQLLERYERARNDPNILSLSEEIALMTFRIGELVQGQKRGESNELWARLANNYAQLATAVLESGVDDPGINDQMESLHLLIKEGVDDSNTWSEVQSLNESKRRLVETQRRTLIEAQQMITVDRMMVLLGAVARVIQEHVTDERIMAAISTDIRQLVDVQAGRPTVSTDGEEAVARLAARQLR